MIKTTKLLALTAFFVICFLNTNILNAQMVGANAYIKGTSVEIGIAGAGGYEGCPTGVSPPLPGMHFRSGNPFFGFVSNPQVNAWATFDGDFFTPGSPENGWGIEIGSGVNYSNNCSGPTVQIPGAMSSWTQTFTCISATWDGNLTTGTNLHIKVNYFLNQPDLFYTTTVSVTNNTAATIADMYYYRNFDPDNNQPISGDFTTQNTIVSQPGVGLCNTAHVKATSLVPASQPMSYVGLAATGANWRATFGGFSNRDGSDIWNSTGPYFPALSGGVGSTAFQDAAIAIAYRIQNLAPGATETFKFVVILDDLAAAQAVANTTYLTYPGSLTAPPASCTPYTDTTKICQGVPATIGVTGPNIASYNWSWSPATGLSSSTGATVSASPTTTTTYTVTGAPINACFAPISFPIVVYVTPSPTVVPETNVTVCAGSVVPLNAFTSTPAGATFTWTNSNTAIGLGASGSGSLPTFTATNAGAVPITSTITVTPTIPGSTCPGVASTFTITINPTPTVTVNSTTICPGQTATLTGTGAASYSWSTGAVTNPITVTPATTASYTVTGTTSGCTNTAVATVTVGGSVPTTVNSPTICAGQTATLTGAGATTYTWSTGAVTNPISVSPATTTTYTVTGNTAGCTGSAIATVTVNPLPITTVNSPTICNGVTATLIGAGATSYSWSTGAVTNPISVTPATTTSYTVTGTSLGCTSSVVSTVTVNPLPVTTVNSPTICPTQTATLTAAGATTYLWSTGSTANPLNVTPAGTTTYTVTGTSLGCTSSAIAIVTVGGSITATVNSSTICAGQTATLTATGGTTYLWNTGSTANPLNISPATTTSYTVTATAGGCTGSAVATVTVNPLPITTVNSPTICNGVTASLTAAGAATYTWTAGATSTGVTTADASPSTTTSYTVTGTSLGCTSTAISTVTVNPIPVTTVNSPSVCPTFTANLVAGGATSYSWTAGVTVTGVNTGDATPATTTTYTDTGNSLGCTSTAVATVTVNAALVVNAGLNDSVCFGGSTVLGVTPNGAGYLYNWTPVASLTGATTATPTSTPATTTMYSVTVTDPSGCIGTSTVTVFANPQITMAIAGIDVTCNGACNGQTIVIPGGGSGSYTYLWNTGCTGASCASLCPNTYSVTVTDTWGCTATGAATVIEPTLLTAVVSATTPTTCNATCDGTATANGAGGTIGAGYSYSWNAVPAQTTATATGLCAGTYTCTITDANSCTATTIATITEPTIVVIAPIASTTICSGGTTSLTASASGGNTGTYSYVWAPAGTGSTATVIVTPAGTTTYTVNASDVNGCPSALVTVTVTINPALLVAASGTTSICPGASANISALATFGNGGPYTYTWAPAGTGSGTPVSVSPAVTTTYTVTASDGCSPTATSTVTITVLPLPVIAISSNLTSGCAPLCVTLINNSTVVGGGIATWIWNYGDGSTPDTAHYHCYNTPGSYDVTLTATSTLGGCSSTSTVVGYITVHPNPVADFTAPLSTSIINPEVTYTDNSTISSGSIASWNWTFGDTFSSVTDNTSTLQNPIHTFTEAGTYCATLTVTSNFGCTDNIQVCVVIEPEFTFFIPNAFSPNGDGINDEFYAKGDFILDFEMFIYDRWGNMIFFADDINKHWDGIASHGKEVAQQDVYVYVVKITDHKDKKHKYMGTVTIVK